MLKARLKYWLAPLMRNAWVLLYHRVSNTRFDAWNNAVSPAVFERHLQWLKQHKTVLPLEEMADNWLQKKYYKNTVALTFDDGYRDNETTARPLLEAYHLPATFFICTEAIQSQMPFWWDRLEAMLVATPYLPAQLEINLNGQVRSFTLAEERQLSPALQHQLANWHYPLIPATRRGTVFLQLWTLLQKAEISDRENALKALEEQIGAPENLPPVMRIGELQAMARHALFTIGAHSHRHSAFQFLSTEKQEEELSENLQLLQAWTGVRPRFFAFPYGSYQANSFQLVEAAGFRAAFVTQPIPLQKSPRPFFGGRISIANHSNLSELLR